MTSTSDSLRGVAVVQWAGRDSHRWLTGAAAAGLAAALALAAFGLPPVELHGVLHRFGIMDPLCGATRAVRNAARGEGREAWPYNPLGIALLLGAVAVLARWAGGLATGRWLEMRVVPCGVAAP